MSEQPLDRVESDAETETDPVSERERPPAVLWLVIGVVTVAFVVVHLTGVVGPGGH